MVLLVPRMFTEEEFKGFVPVLPEDFRSRTMEFWDYVEEKLRAYVGKIQRVYRDEISEGGEKALSRLSNIDHESFVLVKKLVENGSSFEATEDSTLVAESLSWLEVTRHNPIDRISLEMYEETIRERDNLVSRRIDETLREGETALLFLKPGLTISLDESVKIFRVCRFDPMDYLRSWQVQLESKR